MDVESDAHILPRAELVKTVVVALPVVPDQNLAPADGEGEGVSDSDEGPRLEYVTHLELNSDNTQLAAALSSLEVNLYSADTMALAGKLKGQTGPLTQLAFAPSDPSCLFSSSEDGTVRWVFKVCGGRPGGSGRPGYGYIATQLVQCIPATAVCADLSGPAIAVRDGRAWCVRHRTHEHGSPLLSLSTHGRTCCGLRRSWTAWVFLHWLSHLAKHAPPREALVHIQWA